MREKRWLQRGLALILTLLAARTTPAGAEACSGHPDSIDYAMYFMSEVKDLAQCAMKVENGILVISEVVTNPSMACPDMFAWKIFTEIILAEYWRSWASDELTWPKKPYPLCPAGESGPDCCTPGSATNPGYADSDHPSLHCPYFPGDHAIGAEEAVHVAQSPSKAHVVTIAPGRVLRQEIDEIVYRNKAFFNYVFERGLYNKNGVRAVYIVNNGNISANAPYRRANHGGSLAKIEFPIQAIMVKTNWIHKDRAEAVGLYDDPENPYIKMYIGKGESRAFEPGEHWLLAFHVSSKDLPNWFWATFEHVDNPGRCDFLGCNDSYGYQSPDLLPNGAAGNFIQPHQECDDLQTPSYIFGLGQRYDGGRRTPALEAVFDGLDIGTSVAAGERLPSPRDQGWRSYRLKGTQVGFTNAMGRKTYLGNSVIEGGFVARSSCMSCHARAGINTNGMNPFTAPGLGVFVNEVSSVGYAQSNNGPPHPAWYHTSDQPPAVLNLQTDFVWGFFRAQPLPEKSESPGRSASD